MPCAIPEGAHTLTPMLTVENATAALDFYKRAFNATEQCVLRSPDGRYILHADLQIGDSRLYLCDALTETCQSPQKLGGSPVGLHLYVENADAAYQQALDAGCTVTMPIHDAFWGDRFGQVQDPFGHRWSVATHMRDVSADEMRAGAQACLAGVS